MIMYFNLSIFDFRYNVLEYQSRDDVENFTSSIKKFLNSNGKNLISPNITNVPQILHLVGVWIALFLKVN